MTPASAYEIHSEARGPHWVAWITRGGGTKPERSVLVVGGTQRPEAHATSEELAQTGRRLGAVAPHTAAVRERDLGGGDAICRRFLRVACAAEEELRQLLRAADLRRPLVTDRPAAVARDAARAEPDGRRTGP